MNRDVTKTEEFVEKRMESAIATFNNLFIAQKAEMQKLVIETMDRKFNGNMEFVKNEIGKIDKKIDAQDVILKSLDIRIKPFEDTKHWFIQAKQGAGWVAGFLTSLTLIGGVILYLFKKI